VDFFKILGANKPLIVISFDGDTVKVFFTIFSDRGNSSAAFVVLQVIICSGDNIGKGKSNSGSSVRSIDVIIFENI